MGLSKADQLQLWTGLQSGNNNKRGGCVNEVFQISILCFLIADYTAFHSAFTTLRGNGLMSGTGGGDSNTTTTTSDVKNIPFRIHIPSSNSTNYHVIQEPFPPYNPTTGDAYTLADLLRIHVSEEETIDGETSSLSAQLMLHGVWVPLDTPLVYLSQHLAYPDGFLHLVMWRMRG